MDWSPLRTRTCYVHRICTVYILGRYLYNILLSIQSTIPFHLTNSPRIVWFILKCRYILPMVWHQTYKYQSSKFSQDLLSHLIVNFSCRLMNSMNTLLLLVIKIIKKICFSGVELKWLLPVWKQCHKMLLCYGFSFQIVNAG